MKKLCFLSLILFISFSKAQEKTITTKVNSATVFLNSAQVTRAKNISLVKGNNTLKFVNLSPFVDKKSIQIKARDIEILSIDYKKDYLKELEKDPKLKKLQSEISAIEDKIALTKVDLLVVLGDIKFLNSNQVITGKNQNLSVNALKEAATYYSNRIKTLKTKELNLKNKIKGFEEQIEKLKKQATNYTSKNSFAYGEIILKLKSESNKTILFELVYNVSNVGWYPTYDARVDNINSPLQLTYKANLKQNSQVDWKDVKLSFSSSNPKNSSKAKKIIPYFLDYDSYPPNYEDTVDKVSGHVYDDNGSLPGVSIMVKGTTIGTETDFDGYYSLELPKNNKTLEFRYLGYKTKEKRATNNIINVYLEQDSNTLDEVVVVGYGSSKNTKRKKANIDKASKIKIRGLGSVKNNTLKTKKTINQLSVTFDVVKPYSVKSSNKDFIVPIKSITSKSTAYQYVSMPKVDKNAYLIARIPDWETMNLLDGEANIYFEDTFIGNSLITTNEAEEVLELSLGVDKNVSVSREKSADFTTKQFIGSKQQENRVWDYIIKNNKTQTINITILDQIPISTREEIKIDFDNKVSKAILNQTTGEVKWKFLLNANQSKKLKLKYAVKYPKNTTLQID